MINKRIKFNQIRSSRKILIFTGWYPTPERPLDFSFVSQQVKIMKDALPKLSGEHWELIVWHEGLPLDFPNRFVRKISPKNFDWIDEGIKVRYRQSTILSHRLPFNQTFLVKNNLGKTYNEIIDFFGGEPDVVWTVTLSSAILWDWFQKQNDFNVPFFLQEHSVPLSMHLKHKYKRRAAVQLPNSLKEVVVVAERQVEEFKALSANYNCKVIWNAVDPIFLNNPTNIPRKKTLLFVGRLSKQKGVERLLKAFSIVHRYDPEMNLKLIGNGELEIKLKNLAHDLKLEDSVHFLGSKQPEEIANFLEEANLFILPSLYENCPVALLEAQVKGVPCVIVKNGASEKVLLPDNGIVVEDDGSGDQLAIGIIDTLERIDEFERETIRSKGVNAFAPEIFAAKMYEVILETIN